MADASRGADLYQVLAIIRFSPLLLLSNLHSTLHRGVTSLRASWILYCFISALFTHRDPFLREAWLPWARQSLLVRLLWDTLWQTPLLLWEAPCGGDTMGHHGRGSSGSGSPRRVWGLAQNREVPFLGSTLCWRKDTAAAPWTNSQALSDLLFTRPALPEHKCHAVPLYQALRHRLIEITVVCASTARQPNFHQWLSKHYKSLDSPQWVSSQDYKACRSKGDTCLKQ